MQEQKFLLITAFLVALMGVQSIYSILREPQAVASEELKPQKVVQGVQTGRSPANAGPESKKNFRSKSVTVEYNCKGKDPVFEVEGSLLRLMGKGCLQSEWAELSVTNESNGFTGSVIFMKDDKFTTDFIDLKEGDNKLSFKGKNEKGEAVVQNFTVKRRFPASAGHSGE